MIIKSASEGDFVDPEKFVCFVVREEETEKRQSWLSWKKRSFTKLEIIEIFEVMEGKSSKSESTKYDTLIKRFIGRTKESLKNFWGKGVKKHKWTLAQTLE